MHVSSFTVSQKTAVVKRAAKEKLAKCKGRYDVIVHNGLLTFILNDFITIPSDRALVKPKETVRLGK
jgi:hypothetical protein